MDEFFDGNGNIHEWLLRNSDDPSDIELADLLYPVSGPTAAEREEAERERQAKLKGDVKALEEAEQVRQAKERASRAKRELLAQVTKDAKQERKEQGRG